MTTRLWSVCLIAGGLAVALATAPGGAADVKTEAGFVSLFNGRDLTGWKTLPEDKAKWEVKDGAIVGTGEVGHLYSERGDYENFIYRIEAKINDGGNSGQYFRAKMQKGFPPGYEAQINSTHTDTVRTGSLYRFPGNPGVAIREMLVKPDAWFTQEVTADGGHIIIKVNGKTTVDMTDPKVTYAKGHFAIQQHDPGTVIMVRKVEVKELPPSKK
jgi:Domain of Unknown Function (DUF1080)